MPWLHLAWVRFCWGVQEQPVGLAASAPPEVLDSFNPSKTQIAPLEALACLQAFAIISEELAGHDVLLFIDNTSVCSALVKGGSTAADISLLACAAHLLWNFLQCRVYVEYVPSDANISDGLSRDGAQDEWTQAQSWPLFTACCAPWHDLCPHGLGESWKYLLRWGRAEAVALGVRSPVKRASEASAYTPTKRFLDSQEHERVEKKRAAYASFLIH